VRNLSAVAIITEAAECGVSIALNGDKVALRAASKPSTDLLAKLQRHKAEIIALLRDADSAPKPPIAAKTEPALLARVTAPEPSYGHPDQAAIYETAGLAIDGGVPPVYADAWARLQSQRPYGVTDAQWQQALDAGGRFLDEWGSLAAEFGWSTGDLFDAPSDGKRGGLIWWITGEAVRSLGGDCAFAASGRIFDRVTRLEWQNPYRGGIDDCCKNSG
jgi:hypothetical protein